MLLFSVQSITSPLLFTDLLLCLLLFGLSKQKDSVDGLKQVSQSIVHNSFIRRRKETVGCEIQKH